MLQDKEIYRAELESWNMELMAAKEDLILSRDHLAALFNRAPTGYAVLDDKGLIIEANETLGKMLGIEAGVLRGKAFHSLLSLTDQGPFVLRFKALFRGNAVRTLDAVMKTSKGADLHVNMKASLLDPPPASSRRKGQCLLMSIRDISEQKRMEEEREESKAILQQIIDFLPDATFVIDRKGRVIAWNRAIEKMTGKKASEMIGKGDYEYSLAFYDERRPVLIDLVNNPDPEFLSRYEYVRREGDVLVSETAPDRLKSGDRYLLNTACRLFDKKGEVIGAIECIRDITNYKKAEDGLRESEERFRTAFYASPDAVNINRLEDGLWVDVNEGFTRLTGYTREDVLGRSSLDISIWHDPSDRARLVQSLKEKGYCENLEAVFRKKDGSLAIGLMSARVIQIRGVPHILSITRDITAIKDAEEVRKRLQDQLTQAQKMESVGRLAGGIAHDFNNMLSIIMGRADLALANLDPKNPLKKDLMDIKKAAQRSAELTRQLLAFARKQTASPKVINLNETVTGMLKMLRRLIGENIELSWLPGNNLWPVRMDPSQVDQILANLCVNARDAISDVGRITIETENFLADKDYRMTHASMTEGRYVRLQVCDSGCGMDKEVMGRLFEPFFTTKEPGKGTGLGLATVYGIVKQNEGFINVYSEPGRGTTFKIYIPAYSGSEEISGPSPTQGKVKGGDEVILLVEDEPMILEMGRMMLTKLGYRVLAAQGPIKALEVCRSHKGVIDLIITDLVMPEMNGKELAAEISKMRPAVKCLFTSGYSADVIGHHGVLEEGVMFIEKPFSLKALSEKVREALEGRG
jgi:PAS domain S-box-containing protein